MKSSKRHAFGDVYSPGEMHALRNEQQSIARHNKKHMLGDIQEWLREQDRRDAMKANPKAARARIAVAPRAAPRRRHAAGVRSNAASGDSNGDDSDPDPERSLLTAQLLNQASFADLLCVSKKTLQNLYSKTPWLLPVAIFIPGARGPRWTHKAVQEWLEQRPQHTPKPIPQPTKKKVGRPRIALVKQGGASC